MSRHVRFGFSIDFRNPKIFQQTPVDYYAEMLDFITWAETLGYEGVWMPEHHGVEEDDYPPSPLVIASAILARTKTMRVGSGVMLAPLYHPVRLAEDVALIDVMSNGRIELAMGIGYLPAETDAYGVEYKTRARRTDEVIQIVRKLLAGEKVTWKSEFFDIKKARVFPQPVQQGGVPIFVGALSEPGYRRAARFGDGYCGPLESWPAYLQAVKNEGKSEDEARLHLIGATDMWTFVADDVDKAWEEIAPHGFYYSDTYARWQEGTAWGLKKLDIAEFRQSGIMKVLTPEDAIPHFRARMAMAPMETFALKVPTGMKPSKFKPYAETFATKVLPHLR
jgi:alkanesulfonate monooxygenase SsuD/methylene tetrahydromethanopterin reductase-like flavin-dependent oxidoreductase (luciferase family)